MRHVAFLVIGGLLETEGVDDVDDWGRGVLVKGFVRLFGGGVGANILDTEIAG